MSHKIGIDSTCYDLARHFLTDRDFDCEQLRGDEQIAADLTSLSEAIQIAIEDWFAANEARTAAALRAKDAEVGER
jgi:hypothetical protein